MMSWIVVICFTNVRCFPSSTWHIYFEAQYTVFVLSVWMWNNCVRFAIDSVLLVRCRMFSDSPPPLRKSSTRAIASCCLNLIWFIDLEFFPCSFLHRGCFHILLQFPYPEESFLPPFWFPLKKTVHHCVLICSIFSALVLHAIYSYSWILHHIFFPF